MQTGAPAWSLKCRCGEVWSHVEWNELPAIGRYMAGRDGWIELRSCVCGFAMARPVAGELAGETCTDAGDADGEEGDPPKDAGRA